MLAPTHPLTHSLIHPNQARVALREQCALRHIGYGPLPGITTTAAVAAAGAAVTGSASDFWKR